MVETSIEKQPYSAVLFWAVILLGVALRMLLPDRGYNYDFESYRLVADVLSAGGNVYRETSRYNYAPLWSSILQGLDAIPWPGHSDFIALRWKVAL